MSEYDNFMIDYCGAEKFSVIFVPHGQELVPQIKTEIKKHSPSNTFSEGCVIITLVRKTIKNFNYFFRKVKKRFAFKFDISLSEIYNKFRLFRR